MSEFSDETTRTSTGGVLLQSFLVVTGAYLLHLLTVGVLWFFIAMIFFPDSFAILCGDNEVFKETFAQSPEKVLPREMLWCVFAAGATSSFALGYLVARFAPISKFPHSIFFAVIIFVQYLQLTINAADGLQSMLVLFVGACPVTALLGANEFLKRDHEFEHSTEN